MELNNELKLLLIKTEAHKDGAAATGVATAAKGFCVWLF